MKTYILNGDNFSDLEGFFTEVAKMMKADSLGDFTLYSQYADLLQGGYGDHKTEEPICIKWINFQKSKRELGIEAIENIFEITLDCNHSKHNVKLELY